jgi:hypothetical protein
MFIRDPGYEFFHPGSQIQGQKPNKRIQVFLTQKIVLSSGKYEPEYSIFIPDPEPGS